MSKRCALRPLGVDDLRAVLTWRNRPEVRQNMLTRHEIQWDEHLAWFERASTDPTRRLLIVEHESTPIGFVHFTGVAEGGAADWGFYVAPDMPKGTGTKLGAAALDFAFGELALHKVCGQALAFNDASIRMHLRLGFRQEGLLREQHRIDNEHHDLICYGLLRREWP